MIADDLCARAVFKADGSYDLGDLLPSVIGQMNTLLGKAAEAGKFLEQSGSERRRC